MLLEPTTVTIPEKWQPNVRANKQPVKGFGQSSERFDKSYINDRPGIEAIRTRNLSMFDCFFIFLDIGPGYYENDIAPSNLLVRSPSWSKKGYNTFVSKAEKIVDINKHKHRIPGPGQYDLESPVASPVQNVPQNFGSGQEGRVPFTLGPKTPGPMDYAINYDQTPKLLQTKVNATFASGTKRDSFLTCNRSCPFYSNMSILQQYIVYKLTISNFLFWPALHRGLDAIGLGPIHLKLRFHLGPGFE